MVLRASLRDPAGLAVMLISSLFITAGCAAEGPREALPLDFHVGKPTTSAWTLPQQTTSTFENHTVTPLKDGRVLVVGDNVPAAQSPSSGVHPCRS